MYLHKATVKFEEKVPLKVGQCIFDNSKCRASRALRWVLDPANIDSLCYVSKISDKILDLLVIAQLTLYSLVRSDLQLLLSGVHSGVIRIMQSDIDVS